MLSLEESLKHYTVQQLRKEIANYNKDAKLNKTVLSKIERNDLEKLILMNKSKFMHLVLEKAPEKKEVKKKEPTKKEVMKKEVMKKEEEADSEKIRQIRIESNKINSRNLAGTETGTLYLSKKLKDMYNALNETEKKVIDDDGVFKRNIDTVLNNVIKDNNDKIKDLKDEIPFLKNKLKNLQSSIQSNKEFKTKKALENGKQKNIKLDKDMQELKDSIESK